MKAPRRAYRLLLLPVLLFGSYLCFASGGSGEPTEPLPQDVGVPGLKQMLVRLHTTARLMQITAHPDDEDGGAMVLESRGRGVSVLLQTLTRGEGGQNRVGSNLFDELGVLRTLELLAADRYYGIEQRFARVSDFGYSKNPDETFQKWHGHDTALADIVRVIRTFRPDVLVSRFQGAPRDGHGHHQAAGILAREAFRAAADRTRFPEQIREGLQPWQPKKFYVDNVRGTEEYNVELDTGAESPLLGTTYVQFAMQGLRHQLSQGAGSWSVPPGPHFSYYKLVDTVLPTTDKEHQKDFFDGIDTTVPGLATRIANDSAVGLKPTLSNMEEQVEAASRASERDPSDAAGPLLTGLDLTNSLIQQVQQSSMSPGDKAEMLAELQTKQHEFEKAAELALQLGFRPQIDPASHGAMVVAGETVGVTVELKNGGKQAIDAVNIQLDLPTGWKSERTSTSSNKIAPGQTATVKFRVTVPANAELTRPYWHRSDPETQTVYAIDNPRYATLPFPPSPLHAHAEYTVGGKTGVIHADVLGSEGTKQAQVAVVPAFSVLIDPATQVLRASVSSVPVVNVNVRNYVASEGSVALELPPGWTSTPASQPVNFDHLGASKNLRFEVAPPKTYAPGRYEAKALLTHKGQTYSEGFSVVTREDLGTFYYYQPAVQRVNFVEVNVPEHLTLGYVMGAGDDIPTVLEQLGLNVHLIFPEELATGDLSRFETIVTGIRAYDTREDVRKNNARLLDYVFNGGTLLVQYNTGPADFNVSHYTPYPAQLSRDRVSVEDALVTILKPDDPIFHYPNNVTARDFDGWVQERGLYFMDQWDSHFEPLLSCADPGESQHKGGLLRARYGKGTYIYTGYAFFRQLPTGVPGAIRLFINLVSAGHERQ
jgi:LmbE family N-acetylglucosaminyl deacetylase